MATFILTDEFKKILEKQEVIDALANKGYNSIDDFTREILIRLNQFDTNLNLRINSAGRLKNACAQNTV